MEQREGIAQVNQAVVQMDGVVQQSAALVEEAAAPESVQEQAAHLTHGQGFKLDRMAARHRVRRRDVLL